MFRYQNSLHILIHHSPYIVDFRSAGCYHTITGRLQISTRAARQAFRVASLLAGSTSSRPFFCFLCNLRSIHDAQGTDARPCEVSHRYVKSPHQPLRFDVEEGATLNYYNRPKSGPTTSPEGVNDGVYFVTWNILKHKPAPFSFTDTLLRPSSLYRHALRTKHLGSRVFSYYINLTFVRFCQYFAFKYIVE